MKKINIEKSTLENFLEEIKDEYSCSLISFLRFKELFCDDSFDFSKLPKEESSLKKVYKNISSSQDLFFCKVRLFIIQTFTNDFSYCPYCGKNTLIFFDDENNKTKRMFQFDHFFSKNIYHTGIINFYNLIPSCNACNHLKSDKTLNNIKIFHPYFGWIRKEKNNIICIHNDFDNVSFCEYDINSKEFIFNTDHSKYFYLSKIYDKSIRDTSNVFDFIRDTETKIKDELKRFPGKFSSPEEAKKYFFENYYSNDKNKITHFQNGKLKKDLIDNLQI